MQEKESKVEEAKIGQRAAARQWAAALCQYAGVDEAFYEQFWQSLSQSEAVYREFVYYLENQTFLCEYRIAGYTIVDIMVWQMDHFKAYLDRGQDDMKQNGDKMLLMAFDTMLKMEKEPEDYVRRMQSETGTDYPDKY
ncbi:MAG: hypothetical protein NC419_11830 [Muribaculaceae bacterium]|nr:hypothetical protein [Muribaculaceae bacterium]